MSAVKKGDRVRVVLEGEATYAGGGSFALEHGAVLYEYDPYVVSVEVLPRPLKVGDIVEGRQFRDLPEGAVVAGEHGAVIRTPDGYTDRYRSNFSASALSTPRTIVYLPEVAE